MVAAPTTWTSRWLFTDVIVESGNSTCVEAMNAVDYTVFRGDDVKTVMAIHLTDDGGEDAAAGARIAAERNGMAFVDVGTPPGAGQQTDAVSEVVTRDPDLVIIATTPTETAAIVGRAAARGFDGIFITTGPGWDDALLDGPDAEAVRSLLLGARPWRAFSHGTVGHGAMREAQLTVPSSAGRKPVSPTHQGRPAGAGRIHHREQAVAGDDRVADAVTVHNVPLRLPRSRSSQRPLVLGRMTAWWVETSRSSTTTSLSAARPMVSEHRSAMSHPTSRQTPRQTSAGRSQVLHIRRSTSGQCSREEM